MKLVGFSFHVDVKSQKKVEGNISDLEEVGGLDDLFVFCFMTSTRNLVISPKGYRCQCKGAVGLEGQTATKKSFWLYFLTEWWLVGN